MRKISIPDARKAFALEIAKSVGFSPLAKDINIVAISQKEVVVQINEKYYTYSYTTGIQVHSMNEIDHETATALTEKMTETEPVTETSDMAATPKK